MFVNKKQLAVLLVNCFVLGKYRDVTKLPGKIKWVGNQTARDFFRLYYISSVSL